jgi:predicted GH43/DUF377 family glycosyl hydrolase
MVDHLAGLVHHAYYCGEIAAGRRAAERLLAVPGLPVDVEQLARANRAWYTPLVNELVPGVRHVRIAVTPANDGWSTFNPTLAVVAGDLIGIVRSSNYAITNHQYVMPESDGGVIRTDNILVRFASDLSVVSQRLIVAPDYPRSGYPVDGLEDCRLRYTADGVGVSATCRNAAPWTDGRCRIATADLDLRSAALTNLRVLDSISTQEHEKNWMPFMGSPGGWLYACHHDGHLVTVDDNPDVPGGYLLSRRGATTPLVKRCRGGSQLVPFDGGWLGVVHEVCYVGHQRVYEHRLVWLDESLRLSKVSPWFALHTPRVIEFAAGIAVKENNVVISYGLHDAEAWLCELPVSACQELLDATL